MANKAFWQACSAVQVTFLLCISSAHALDNDKILHTEASAVIAYAGTEAFKDSEHPVLYPFATALAFGAAKEATDSRFDHNDLSADAVGALIGTTLGSQKYILTNWGKTDKYLFQTYVAASAYDFFQTTRALRTGFYQEGNPGLGTNPSATKLFAVKVAGAYAIYWVADNTEYKTVPLAALVILQLLVDRHNYFEIRI